MSKLLGMLKFTTINLCAVCVIYVSFFGFDLYSITSFRLYKLYYRNYPQYVASNEPVVAKKVKSNNQYKDQTPILIYHRITNDKNILKNFEVVKEELAVTPEKFEQDIKNITSKGYKYITMDQLYEDIHNQNSYKRVIMTIDDGYNDVYKYVYPLLKKYNIVAEIYLISDFIDTEGYLSYEEILEMKNSGHIVIGGHSVKHYDITELTLTNKRTEIAKSKYDLEKIFGIEIKTFAFPYGKYDENSLLLLSEAGYKYAVNSDYDPFLPHTENNVYEWGRVPSSMESDYSEYGIK